jgi:LL-diaminopimelate aminotransferase
MRIEQSERLRRIPPYLFAGIEDKVAQMRARGEEIYDLSIGDPDLPTPPEIVKVLQSAMAEKENQGYSSSKGEVFFREAVSEWYAKRFGVKVDASKEVCALIGSKEGLANISNALVNPGEKIIVPNPGYPVYANGATFLSGGRAVTVPLLEENGFLPEIGKIDHSGAKIMYLNYPNNPTGAVAGKGFLKEAVDFARDRNVIICYDNAYSEMSFGTEAAHSILEIPGALECCVEFNSCSKTFNMTGSRAGFAVGAADAVSALAKVKSQMDSGLPPYVQRAGAYALSLYRGKDLPAVVKKNVDVFAKRMKLLSEGLCRIGISCRPSPATFYLWVKVGGSSIAYADKLLEKGIVVTPGIGFGSCGEGFIRFALTRDEATLRKVIEQLGKMKP